MNPEIEFQTLREEMREWQARRFTLLGVTSVFLTAYIGWVVNNPENWSWEVATIPIFLVVIGSALLTKHFNQLIVRISAYLEVFHNFKWQSRLSLFRESVSPLHTNQLIAIFNLGNIVTAILTFENLCRPYINVFTIVLATILCFMAVYFLIAMAYSSNPYEKYKNSWEKMKSDENT